MTLRVRASSLEQLAHDQGRRTAGPWAERLSEDVDHLLARTGTAWDAVAAGVDLVDLARRAFEALDPESQAFFSAYASGVASVLGDDWQPWTPLGIWAVHHVVFGPYGHHLWRRHVDRTLGPDARRALAHEAPALSGSNAWVLGGARTATGSPMIGADPHRMLSWPGVYQRVHLVVEPGDGPGGGAGPRAAKDSVDVLGLTIPGVPGVQHFGHTGSVAWAITNAMADTQDVVETPDGPSMRWVADDLGDLGLSAILPLLRARTAEDVDRAFDSWVEPVDDVLIADDQGTVRHRVAGRVPVRDDQGRWTGWAELPTEHVAPTGHVVSANHRRGPESDAIATEFAPPHRARRLEQLLDARSDVTVDEAEALHRDTLLLPAAAWQDRLAGLPAVGLGEPVRRRILDWDGHMDAGSLGAGAFGALRSTVARSVAAHPALAPLADASDVDAFWSPWLEPVPRVALALDRWMAEGAPFGIDLDHELAAGLVAVAGEPEQTWGQRHVIDVPGHGRYPVHGDDGCVWSTAGRPGLTDGVWRGPVARLVWDLSDRSRSRWAAPDVAAGPEGEAALADWLAGRMEEVGA